MSERGSPAQPHRHHPRQRERILPGHESFCVLQDIQVRSHLMGPPPCTRCVIDGKLVTWHMPVYTYKGGPKTWNSFIKNCVLILTCLNFSHPQ